MALSFLGTARSFATDQDLLLPIRWGIGGFMATTGAAFLGAAGTKLRRQRAARAADGPRDRRWAPWPASSGWTLGLSVFPALAIAGFAFGTVILLLDPPEPDDDLPRNAWLAFTAYTALSAAVLALGLVIVFGTRRGWTWARPLGVLTFGVAAALITLGLATGANDATPAVFAFGGATLIACLATAALLATGR
ncbi:hypothetical protein BH10ACT1_BH10ACT1_18230 [soil metagenome]